MGDRKLTGASDQIWNLADLPFLNWIDQDAADLVSEAPANSGVQLFGVVDPQGHQFANSKAVLET